MQTAWGMTSPKNKTAVTDIIIAHNDGTSSSKNIGRASMANAFDKSRVTKSQWCCFKMGKITSA